jgi:DNA-binding CsgD family transcriptional regulator
VVLTAARTLTERRSDIKHGTIAAMFLGHVARGRGRYDEAADWAGRAKASYEQLGNRLGVAWATHDLGLLARDRGDPREAVRLLRVSCDEFAAIEAPWARGWAAAALGTVLCAAGQPREAGRHLGEAVDVLHSFDDGRGVAQCIEALAALACEVGAFEAASRLLGSAANQRTQLGAPPTAGSQARIASTEVIVAGALGQEYADQLRANGRSMTMAETLTLAHEVAGGLAVAEPGRPAPDTVTLTRREQQVAVLVASGRTNRQIGRTLGIAEKTVEVHLKNAMAKLGARSRAEVAVWAVAKGPALT